MSASSQGWPTLEEPEGKRVFARVRWALLAMEIGILWLALRLGEAEPLGMVLLVGLGLLGLLVVVLPRPGAWLPPVAGGLMVLDALRLTGLFALSGGASTPLSAAYLVLVVMAALLLSPGWIAAVVLASVSGYGLLFLAPPPRHHHHDMYAHVLGMWATVALISPLVAGAIVLLRRALHRVTEEARQAREVQERGARLAAVGTLAAGAAHELSTPLATIAVAAGELSRSLGDDPRRGADVRLVQSEVARCREILGRLTQDVGAGTGELLARQPVGDVLDAALQLLDLRDHSAALERIDLRGEDALLDRLVLLPQRQFSHALSGVIKNALQADPAGTVELCAWDGGPELCIEVRDAGLGMAPAVLERAQEPFFTTREPGEGMGLGLFVASSVVRQLGGRLDLRSAPEQGSAVRFTLPWTEIEP